MIVGCFSRTRGRFKCWIRTHGETLTIEEEVVVRKRDAVCKVSSGRCYAGCMTSVDWSTRVWIRHPSPLKRICYRRSGSNASRSICADAWRNRVQPHICARVLL